MKKLVKCILIILIFVLTINISMINAVSSASPNVGGSRGKNSSSSISCTGATKILSYTTNNVSTYSGTINKDNIAKTLSVTLDNNSILKLTGDSYISTLNNELTDNSNINLNGYTLYVNGNEIVSTSYRDNTIENDYINQVTTEDATDQIDEDAQNRKK